MRRVVAFILNKHFAIIIVGCGDATGLTLVFARASSAWMTNQFGSGVDWANVVGCIGKSVHLLVGRCARPDSETTVSNIALVAAHATAVDSTATIGNNSAVGNLGGPTDVKGMLSCVERHITIGTAHVKSGTVGCLVGDGVGVGVGGGIGVGDGVGVVVGVGTHSHRGLFGAVP